MGLSTLRSAQEIEFVHRNMAGIKNLIPVPRSEIQFA